MIASLHAVASALAQPFLWFFGHDRYYNRYERSLDKLSKRIASLKVVPTRLCNAQHQCSTPARRRNKSSRRKATPGGPGALPWQHWRPWSSHLPTSSSYVATAALAISHRPQAEHWGVSTWSPLLYATASLGTWAIALVLLHRYSAWRQRSIGRKLQYDQAQLAKLINSLKDGSHFDKVQQLLRKYDPAYQPIAVPIRADGRTPAGKVRMEHVRGSVEKHSLCNIPIQHPYTTSTVQQPLHIAHCVSRSLSCTSTQAPGTPQRGLAGVVVGALGSTMEGLANQLAGPGEATALDALRCVVVSLYAWTFVFHLFDRASQAECTALRGQVSYWQQLAFHCRDVVDRQQRDINAYRARLGMEPGGVYDDDHM